MMMRDLVSKIVHLYFTAKNSMNCVVYSVLFSLKVSSGFKTIG